MALAQVTALAGRLVIEPLIAAVFPASCPLCGKCLASPYRGPLCGACLGALPRHATSPCACGQPLVTTLTGVCGRCRRGQNPIARGASLGPYESSLRAVIHELKFHGRRRIAVQLGRALWALPRARALIEPEVLLVPVPLHPRRRVERGFNQSELIARELARLSRQRVCADVLVRRRLTAPQTGLTAAARRTNVARAFRVRRPSAIAGRTIVLVDDVVTTGATALACARCLRDAGAADVRLLTLARTL
jgi:competence protein ComFC